MSNSPLSPGDPLLRNSASNGQALFTRLAAVCEGFGWDDVNDAVINLLVNSIRQSKATKKEAEEKWDELFGKGKSLLLDQHYDSVTGKRKTVFPFTQVVKMPHHKEPF